MSHNQSEDYFSLIPVGLIECGLTDVKSILWIAHISFKYIM